MHNWKIGDIKKIGTGRARIRSISQVKDSNGTIRNVYILENIKDPKKVYKYSYAGALVRIY